jgi:threonine synthase
MSSFDILCRQCRIQIAYTKPLEICPVCGAAWFDAVYDYAPLHEKVTPMGHSWRSRLAAREATLWRYRELLPICQGDSLVTLGEGWTPLYRAQNLGLMLGHPHIYIKDERQNPTGSFKDRQAAIAINAMKEAGIKEAVVASTGNVAIAYSAYGARAGIKLWVFVPSSVPSEKMREVAIYGSEVIKVAGTYDQTKAVAAEFAHSKRIFLDKGVKGIAAKEAMKTVAFEIAEQLGSIRAGDSALFAHGDRYDWQVPDWYVQAVSGGLGPIGVMKGFRELNDLGIVTGVPRLACFQSSGCAPMANAFAAGLPTADPIDNPMTDIATLATGDPGTAYEVINELIRQYGGTIEAITDKEAFQALHAVAKMDGISVEPATAVAFAGLFKLIRQGTIEPEQTVVINCSGHTFPVEKHIVGEYYRDMTLTQNEAASGREEGLLTALEELDPRVQRIVIVEDNPDSARLIRRILQARGDFHIDEAKDGSEGLTLIREIRPNLVILDLMMPEIDGFGLVEAMKNEAALREIPIIVVTAKELSAVERQRLNGKIKGLLQKGTFMDSDLLHDIRQALP